MKYGIEYTVPDAEFFYKERVKKFEEIKEKQKKYEKIEIPKYDTPAPKNKAELVSKLKISIQMLDAIDKTYFNGKKRFNEIWTKQNKLCPQSAGMNEIKPLLRDSSLDIVTTTLSKSELINKAIKNKDNVAKQVREKYKTEFKAQLEKKDEKKIKRIIGICSALFLTILWFISLIGDFANTCYQYIFAFSLLLAILSSGISKIIVKQKNKAITQYNNNLEKRINEEIAKTTANIDNEIISLRRKSEIELSKMHEENNNLPEKNKRIIIENNKIMQKYMFENERRAESAFKQYVEYDKQMKNIAFELKNSVVPYQMQIAPWFPDKYSSQKIIQKLIEYLENSRADSLKEAINLYEDELNKKALYEQRERHAKEEWEQRERHAKQEREERERYIKEQQRQYEENVRAAQKQHNESMKQREAIAWAQLCTDMMRDYQWRYDIQHNHL